MNTWLYNHFQETILLEGNMFFWSAITSINWLAVLVAWVMHVVISLVWYQPFLFGKAWVKLSGKDMKPAIPWMPAGLVAHFAAVFGLAVIMRMANATTAVDGIILGAFVAICFIGAMLAGELIWEKIPFRLFLIRLGDQVLTLCLAGVILALWR
jgi:hypothetical protein